MIAATKAAREDDKMSEERRDLETMDDLELVQLYASTDANDPEIDRIANVMQERGIDLPPSV